MDHRIDLRDNDTLTLNLGRVAAKKTNYREGSETRFEGSAVAVIVLSGLKGLARRALFNKTQKAVDGPLLVRVYDVQKIDEG